jgi:hypothetical protein
MTDTVKIQVNVRVPEEQYVELRREADEQNRTVPNLVWTFIIDGLCLLDDPEIFADAHPELARYYSPKDADL